MADQSRTAKLEVLCAQLAGVNRETVLQNLIRIKDKDDRGKPPSEFYQDWHLTLIGGVGGELLMRCFIHGGKSFAIQVGLKIMIEDIPSSFICQVFQVGKPPMMYLHYDRGEYQSRLSDLVIASITQHHLRELVTKLGLS